MKDTTVFIPQVLAAESQSPDLSQSQGEGEETSMNVVPETDLDTQSTEASQVSATEAMQLDTAPPESAVESHEQAPSEDVEFSQLVVLEEDVSQGVSEMPTQMTQVTQSQDATQVGKSDSTDEYVSPPPLSITQVTSQEPSVTIIVDSMGKEPQTEVQTSLSSEAATVAQTMSSEAEMVRRKSMQSREVSSEPSLREIERQTSTDVSGTDSQPIPALVDSSEPSSMTAGVPTELEQDMESEPMEAVGESREESQEGVDEREGGDEVASEETATFGQADTTQSVQGEGMLELWD